MRGRWLDDDDLKPEPYVSKYSLSSPTFDDTPDDDAPRRSPRVRDSATGPMHDTTPGWVGLVTGAGGIAAIGVVAAGVATGNTETQIAGMAMIVVGAVAIGALKRVAADCTNGEYHILLAGLSVKLLGTLLRYWVAFSGALYTRSDALTYHEDGQKVATEFLAHGHLPPYKSFVGTNFLRLLTGLLYSVMPPSKLGAFFVFAMFSFAGNVLFWRAARRTMQPGRDRRYLYMVMFIPSIVYWPSSLGKEAVVILGLGLAALGFARTVTNAALSGTILLGLGLMLATYVRPHIALVIVIAVGVATLLRSGGGGRQVASSVLVVGLLIPVGGAILGQANALFKTDITSQEGRNATQKQTQERTDQGNSQFENQAVSITNPVQFPYAAMTVILRPFPWEAGSPQEFATAIESLFIGFLLIKGITPLARSIRRSNPYAIFALTNLIVFIVLFSNFNNFGILARQRTQVAPFLFFLMALPKAVDTVRHRAEKPDWEYVARRPAA